MFLPSVPVLLSRLEMEAQRDRAGQAARQEGWRTSARAGQPAAGRTPRTTRTWLHSPAPTPSSTRSSRGLLGTATFAGSAEEADYIGLPGLLGAEDVKALLRQREKEQVKQRSAQASGPGAVSVVGADPEMSGATIPGNVAGAGARAGAAADRVASAAELKELRRQLNTLVSVYSGRLGMSHGAIHSRLRNACGGPPVPMASADQIKRISTLRSW